ncbi:MAG: cell division protein ZapA [Desulfuromusa sp.]|nr:cell division protein ZapA [Desulfuromusa sp.]
MNPTVQIKILGREYSLRSQESETEVQRVVEFIEAKLAETATGRSVDTRDLTVLTLLNLAGQYLQLLDQENPNAAQQDIRLQRLVDSLEQVVADNSGC